MSEAEWLAATDPAPMLGFLQGKASERKRRLFCCACCRNILHLIPDERSRNAVSTVEHFVDGQSSWDEFRAAEKAAMEAEEELEGNGTAAVSYTFQTMNALQVQRVAEFASSEFANPARLRGLDGSRMDANVDEERRRQTDILRDIFGNPFYPVAIDPTWLTSTVLSLAIGIYDEKAFDRLPILADALQDAGCDNDDILSHLRGGGLHIKGCWALDALLGKT